MTDTLGMVQRHAEVLTVVRRSEAEETATRAIGTEDFSSIGYILIYGEAAEVYKGPIERRTVNKPKVLVKQSAVYRRIAEAEGRGWGRLRLGRSSKLRQEKISQQSRRRNRVVYDSQTAGRGRLPGKRSGGRRSD